MDTHTALLETLSRREADAEARAEGLRERVADLSEELALVEAEITRLEVTRDTLTELIHQTPPPGRSDTNDADYQAILVAFDHGAKLRVRDLCERLGLDTGDNDLKRTRARLKRLVARRQLAEPEPGLFTAPRR